MKFVASILICYVRLQKSQNKFDLLPVLEFPQKTFFMLGLELLAPPIEKV